MLKNLQQDQAGEYFCKAQSDAGAAKSRIAQLTVIGKPGRAPGEPLPQLAESNSQNVGCPGLCAVLCFLGHKDGTDLGPTLTDLPLQEGWRNKRQVSRERENAAVSGDKQLWILQMRNRELQVGMTVGAGCWRLKQWFLALVTHWDQLLHCFFFKLLILYWGIAD